MSASAFDAVARGLASLRANWRLVPLLWLQQVIVVVLLALGTAVPLAVVGGRGWGELGAALRGQDAEAALLEVAGLVAPLALPLAIALLGTAIVWTLAVIVFCWFQGGSLAVLVAAERQAPPGPPRDWRLFHTYERELFAGWARRLTWRFFAFWNLWGLAVLGWSLALVGLLVAVQWAAVEWGLPGLAGVGVGGALAVGFGFLVLAGWGLVAPPALAADEAGVGPASRRALGLLGRRPVAVALVVAVFLGLWVVVAVACSGLAVPLLLLDTGRPGGPWLGVSLAGQGLVWLLQLAATVAVGTAMNAALAALVVGDLRMRAGESVEEGGGGRRRGASPSPVRARKGGARRLGLSGPEGVV